MSQPISEQERQRREKQREQQRPRAYLLSEFCNEYRCTRTRAYEEMKAGRLKARKAGRTVIITGEDAEAWLQSLPMRSSSTVPEEAAA
jgi:hypothetical protein